MTTKTTFGRRKFILHKRTKNLSEAQKHKKLIIFGEE